MNYVPISCRAVYHYIQLPVKYGLKVFESMGLLDRTYFSYGS